MVALTDEILEGGGSPSQELYDIESSISNLEWDAKFLKDDLEWQEKKSELNEYGL